MVVFENTLGDKNMFNVDDQEDTRTASVNVIQMFLQLAGNLHLKSLTESVCRKASGLSSERV